MAQEEYISHLEDGQIHPSVSMTLTLLFGKNPQVVAYSAQPRCSSRSEISSPTTHRGAIRKDGAEIP